MASFFLSPSCTKVVIVSCFYSETIPRHTIASLRVTLSEWHVCITVLRNVYSRVELFFPLYTLPRRLFSAVAVNDCDDDDGDSLNTKIRRELAMSSSSLSSQDAIPLRSPRNTRQQYPPSPPLSSRSSNDSNDSLRALELSDGPIDATRLGLGATAASSSSATRAARSYSFSGFDFQQDLLPLSTSLSEPERGGGEGGVGEKSIGLVNGALGVRCLFCLLCWDWFG
jgi:hypothetical protein